MKISEFRKIIDLIDNKSKSYDVDSDINIALFSKSIGSFTGIESVEYGFGLNGFEVTIYAEDLLKKANDI